MNVRIFIAALILGAATSLAYPPCGFWWIMPALIGIAALGLERIKLREAALASWIFGIALLSVSLWWVVEGAAPYLGWWVAPLAILVCALESVPFAIAGLFYGWAMRRSRMAALFGTPALFALFEELRTIGPAGLPFATLGSAQSVGPLAALLPVGGVIGTSFAVVFVALGIARIASAASAASAVSDPPEGETARVRIGRKRGERRTRVAAIGSSVVALGLVLVALLDGLATARPGSSGTIAPAAATAAAAAERRAPRIGIVRAGAIDAGEPFAEGVARYAAATQTLRAQHPLFVVWPEGVVFDTQPDAERQDATLAKAARQLGAPILTGATVVVHGAIENVLLEQDPNGTRSVLYVKRRTVPIGEDAYSDGAGGPSIVGVAGQKFAPLICYEVGFEDLARTSAASGAPYLIAVLNDSHFAATAGPLWQAEQLRLRTLEDGIPAVLVDAAGPTGVIGGSFGSDATNDLTDTDTARIATVPAPQPATIYRRFGAWPPAAMLLAIAALALAVAATRRAGRC